MSTREFTVKMAPQVGLGRVQLCGLIPDDAMYGASGSGSIVEVELLRVVAGYDQDYVAVHFQEGDMPYGTFFSRHDNGVLCRLSKVVPARWWWNVIVAFHRHCPFITPHEEYSLQQAASERHALVRVSSRPA